MYIQSVQESRYVIGSAVQISLTATWPRLLLVSCLLLVGHVGPPLPSNIFKVVDVPEMDYYAAEGKGEVSN